MVVYTSENITVCEGDCLDMLAILPDRCVDAVVTDPPYLLSFMGKTWDSRPAHEHLEWHSAWASECFRLLRPGGHLLAFGGTRTSHRLACAIEDAGFEIRDSIAWLYGSGFPKSLDVSKAIDKAAGAEREIISTGAAVKRMIPGADQNATGSWIKDNGREFIPTATDAAKQWQGWGTALKPSHEPIVVARKPIQGTVAGNVLAHGTGALNIDACRVGTHQMVESRMTQTANGVLNANGRDVEHGNWKQKPNENPAVHTGRWPPNVVLDGDMADELDKQSGIRTSGKASPGGHKRAQPPGEGIYGGGKGLWTEAGDAGTLYGDSGGASRFFPVFRYQAKAAKKERPTVEGISHPTVKPLELMKWLVRLVTPPGGIVLDPFAGSGTTGEAAVAEGMHTILIERESDYIKLILARLGVAVEQAS